MKRIAHYATARDKLLHIETEGGIVNIRVGLTDADGRAVTSVQIIPDQYAGEEWDLFPGNRLVRRNNPATEGDAR